MRKGTFDVLNDFKDVKAVKVIICKETTAQMFMFGRLRYAVRSFLFQILVEPAEEFAVPDERVLRFEHLVRFVLELDEPCRNAADAGGGEGFERLRVRDAEVVFAGI